MPNPAKYYIFIKYFNSMVAYRIFSVFLQAVS